MEYIDVIWTHQHASEPVRCVSELDADRYEIRKLEFFSGGTVGYASKFRNASGTELGSVAVPPLAEINQSAEFNGVAISADAFETLWRAHVPRQERTP